MKHRDGRRFGVWYRNRRGPWEPDGHGAICRLNHTEQQFDLMAGNGRRGAWSILTFGAVGRIKIDGRPRFPEAIWGYTYNDRPLADAVIPAQKTKEHDRFLELLALVCGLGPFEPHVQIEDRVNGVQGKQEKPDFFITLKSGQLIGAEITRLTDPKRTTEWNLIQQLDADFAQAFANDAVLGKRYESVSLSIQVAIRHFRGYDSKALIAVMLNRLRSKSNDATRPQHIDRVRLGDDATLCSHSFSLIMCERRYPWTEITPHVRLEPVDGTTALLDRIKDKIGRSKNYDRRAPLWLVVPIADPWGQYSYPLEQFEDGEYEITPFERLILANPERAIIKFNIAKASMI